MVSIALCDYLTQHKGQHIKLIESDTSNPDVGKIFAKDEKVEVISCRLDDADGWIEQQSEVYVLSQNVCIDNYFCDTFLPVADRKSVV